MDDNFCSIVYAIEAGRLVFANIRKTIAYTVSHAIPELVPVFIFMTFDFPLALPALLILSVDLLTEQVCCNIRCPLFNDTADHSFLFLAVACYFAFLRTGRIEFDECPSSEQET